MIGAESEYLTGRNGPSDIDTLRTHCLAILVMAAWAYEKQEAAAPKDLRFAPVCFWVAWERSSAHICLNLILVESGVENLDKAYVTDLITLGIIAITGFEDSC